jgi:hypothetical protein
MSMNTNELIIKCFAKKEQDLWVAICLDFCLASQGDTFEEAKNKLEQQITDYVTEALQDAEYGSQLLSRKAPLSTWIEYYCLIFINTFLKGKSYIFNETLPLRLA